MYNTEYNYEDLLSVCTRILAVELKPNEDLLTELKTELNTLFSDNKCISVDFTINTDNLFFGMAVMPSLVTDEVLEIILGDDNFYISKYFVELDSKILSLSLTPEELASYILFEVSSIIEDKSTVKLLRATLDSYFLDNDSNIDIKNSTQYHQLLNFALTDTVIKNKSLLYVDQKDLALQYQYLNDFISNSNINHTVDNLNNVYNKIYASAWGEGTSYKYTKTLILNWIMYVYKDVAKTRIPALITLRDAKDATGSLLIKREVQKVINALERIDTDLVQESAIIVESAKKKISLFKQLKNNGLRGIEDDLYMLQIRLKNADTEDEVMYTLRQINTRLAILDDYISNEELSDEEHTKWLGVLDQYKLLRDNIAAKKIYNKKNYGIWYSYNQLGDEEKAQSQPMY